MSPPKRALGRDGPLVSAVGFGTMSLGGVAYDRKGQTDTEETKFALLDRAHAIGEHFWDSADIYAESEDIIGKWFKRTGKRDDIFIATKFGLRVEGGAIVGESTPEYAKACCERSLKRLDIETIDLYYCHRVDTVTPIEKTIQAMVDLKK
jgi:aryl-alcohol dehydrogenase-like predicted oxidoreductase